MDDYSFIRKSVPDLKRGFRLVKWGNVMYSLLVKTTGEKDLLNML